MHALVLSLDAVAVLGVAAALGAAFVLYGTWRTRVLRLYTVFLATIAAFSVAMGIDAVAKMMRASGSDSQVAGVLGIAALLLQTVGGVVHVAVLPHFVYAINNRHPSVRVQRIFLALALTMAGLATVFVARPSLLWVGFTLTGILFASIGYCIALMLIWVLKGPVAAHDLDTRPGLRAFIWLSLGFLPLFVADIVISQVPVSPLIIRLDGTSLPAYLIVLATGSMVFARKRLNMPALYRDDQLTEYCRTRFSLTDRETQVVEYVMEGYSVPDLAGVLDISAKTAENHLYSAYQKLSVSNRIQLFQILMAHR